MATKGKQIKKQSKLKLLVNSPIRFLCKVKDVYVNIITMCDAQMGGYGGGAFISCPAYCPTALPKSFSVNSSNKSRDTKSEKSGSTKRMTSDELDRKTRCSPTTASGTNGVVMGRSYSVGVVRIDEDEVCEFGEELEVVARTRS